MAPPRGAASSLLDSILALRQQLAAARQHQHQQPRGRGTDADATAAGAAAASAPPNPPPPPAAPPAPMPAVAFHTAPLPARAGAVGDHAWDQQRCWTKKQRWRQAGDEDDGGGSSGKRRPPPPPPPLVRTDPKSAAAAADAQRYLASAPPRGFELKERGDDEGEPSGPGPPPRPPPLPPPAPLPPSPSAHPHAAFPTQRRAFDFWDAHPLRAHLRCFAVEHAPRAGEFAAATGAAAQHQYQPAPAAGRGSRSFLITTDERLWSEYRGMPARHHYEIIREGRPCHLYFDLEHYYSAAAAAAAAAAFPPSPRPLFPPPPAAAAAAGAAPPSPPLIFPPPPAVDGARLVELLLDEVESALTDVFGEGTAVDRARDVIELDSTRAPVAAASSSSPSAAAPAGGKFSRHLIVRVPGAAFADNAHAGAFVRLVCARLLAKAARAPGGEHAGFLVAPRGGGGGGGQEGGGAARSSSPSASSSSSPQHETLQLFVDTGVYTRNRAFRMYLSSKAAAAAVAAAAAPHSAAAAPPPPPPPLVPTRRFGGRLAVRTPGELFFDSLVTRVVGVGAQVGSGKGAAGGGGGGGGGGRVKEDAEAPAAATAATAAAATAAAAAKAPPPLRLLRMDAPRARELEADAQHEAEPMARRLLTPSLSACTPLARVRVPGAVGAAATGAAGGQQQLPRSGFGAGRRHDGGGSDGGGLAVLHDGPSPYGSLMAFLGDAATRFAFSSSSGGGGGAAAAVARAWAHAPRARVVLAPFRAPFRWCGNVGRHHRSNGVFAVADLEAGVWYMRCYDPDCSGWRSPALPLPSGVWREAAEAAEAAAAGAEAAAAAAGRAAEELREAGGEDEEAQEEDEDAYYHALLDAVDAGACA